MTSSATIPRSTKERIVLAAEQLFAERGYEGVSLREIGAAAGSSNNSAVQYHFGTKEQLVAAIFENRLSYIDDRRSILIAQLEPLDVRSWVECYILPLLEQGEIDGSHYMSFIAAVEQQVGIFEHLPERFRARTQSFRKEVGAFMTTVPEPLRTHRILQVVRFSVHAASARERAKAQRFEVLPFAVHVADLLDGLAGFLQAPVSSVARASIIGYPTEAPGPPFLV
jgi:AcrR family transcriptional regulator